MGTLAYSHGVLIIKDFKAMECALVVLSLRNSRMIVNLVMLPAATHEKK